MLNKKKVVIAVLILLIIIGLIIFMILRGKSSNGSKVSNLYKKISNSNEYSFTLKDQKNYEITIAKKDDKVAIDMNNEGERITTLINDNKEYLITHSEQKYFDYERDENSILIIETMKDLTNPDSTGTEKINGKKYSYEEYKGFESFMTSTGLRSENENVATKFYFKGNELAYIKTTTENLEEDLLEIDIKYSAPDELFEIPSNYSNARDEYEVNKNEQEEFQEGDE